MLKLHGWRSQKEENTLDVSFGSEDYKKADSWPVILKNSTDFIFFVFSWRIVGAFVGGTPFGGAFGFDIKSDWCWYAQLLSDCSTFSIFLFCRCLVFIGWFFCRPLKSSLQAVQNLYERAAWCTAVWDLPHDSNGIFLILSDLACWYV